jgi:glutamyl-tRNA reductase
VSDAPHGSLVRLLVVGTCRRRVPTAVAPALFGDAAAVPALLDDLARVQGNEAMVLATSERLEFILVRGEDWGLVERLTSLLADRAGLGPRELGEAVYAHEGDEALRHIFDVASALDSEVAEEPRIQERLERCHEMACARGMGGPSLDAAVRGAMVAARRIEKETPLAERSLSMAAVATQVARGLHGDPARCRVLLVGLGELGQLLADELRQAGAAQITVVHASPRRAETVARRLGGHFRPWEQLDAALADAEIVVSDRGTGQWTVSRAAVEQALRQRRHRPILFIDVGLPCDVDDGVDALPDAFLYRLDDLERIAFEGKAARGAASVMAHRILAEEHAAAIQRWTEPGEPGATATLRTNLEEVRAQVLAEQPDNAEAATRRFVEKLLERSQGVPDTTAAEDTTGARRLSETLGRLFGLKTTRDDGAQGDDE